MICPSPNKLLFASATQCLVKIDPALQLGKTIGHLLQFCTEQRLSGGQYFQIGTISVIHLQHRASLGPVQGFYLFRIKIRLIPAGLPSREGIVHLRTRIEQGLLETQFRLFLLRFGNLQISYILPAIEERLGQRANGRSEELTGIDNHRAGIVRPACASTQRDIRIEIRTSLVRSIEGGLQRMFCRPDIWTVCQELKRKCFMRLSLNLFSGCFYSPHCKK